MLGEAFLSAPDIFLSYNRDDQAVAKRYADAFAAEGLELWWDTALRSGEAYDEVTEAALEKWELPKRRAFLPGSRI